MSNFNNKKACAEATGFNAVMANYRIATFADVAGHETLENLLAENIIDNSIRYLHDNISIYTGDLSGTKALDTKGDLGLIMLDNQDNAVNLGCIPLNSKANTFISDSNLPSAFVIGTLNIDSTWIAINNLDDAWNCYKQYKIAGIDVTVLTCLVPSLLNKMVRHFAEIKVITLITTTDKRAKLIASLKGINAELIVCEHTPIYEAMQYGASYDDLMADANIIDLKGLGHPKPKPINQTLPPVKTFTKEMMPEALWNYAYDCANRMSAPIEYVLIPLVVVLGSVIGAKVTVYPKARDNWESSCNFYGVTIGNPSSKKSPTLTDALSPINYLEALATQKYQDASLEYQVQKEVNKHITKVSEKELENLTKQMVSQADDLEDSDKISLDDLKAKAQTLAEAKQADELIPCEKRYSTNDGNMESIGELESKHKNGILIIRDELTGWFATLDGDKNSQPRSFILEGYNGLGSFKVDRIGRGHIPIATHCLSVIGSMQPDKLEYYLNKTMKGLENDGFIQRFQLMVYPDPLSNAKEKDLLPDKQSRDAIYSLFETIDTMQLGDFVRYGANPIDEHHKRPYYRFDDKAYPNFMNWYNDLKAKAGDVEHSIIAEHLIKYSKTVPALALIFHLIDCIKYDENLGAISDTALEAAIAWCEVLQTHMLRVYSLVIDSANLKASHLSKKILNMVKRGSDKTDLIDWIEHGFTARQVIRKGWKGLAGSDDVQNALEVLIEHDWLRWERIESTGQGGRPTERYYINPRISELI